MGRGKHFNRNLTKTRVCSFCKQNFQARDDAKTCSNRCRMAFSRKNRVGIKIEEIPEYIEETVDDRQTWLYKVFNRADNLLYVGITHNPVERMKSHKSHSIWWEDKEQMTWQSFETRHEAEIAERLSIKNDNPVFNIRGK